MKCKKCGGMQFLFRSSGSISLNGVDSIDVDANVICSGCGTPTIRVGYERRMSYIEEQLEQVAILLTYKEGLIDELTGIQDKIEELDDRIKNLERKQNE